MAIAGSTAARIANPHPRATPRPKGMEERRRFWRTLGLTGISMALSTAAKTHHKTLKSIPQTVTSRKDDHRNAPLCRL
jgi:hypothetical protein